MRRAVALLLALAASGCVLSGAPDDLEFVCEQRSGAPGHPYRPDELPQVTREVDAPPAALRDALYKTAADSLVTLGRQPYAEFRATLRMAASDLWRFEANGTWRQGQLVVNDTYVVDIPVAEGRLAMGEVHVLEAPPSLRAYALDAVNRSGDVAWLRISGAVPTLWRWDDALPGCVQLTYRQPPAVTCALPGNGTPDCAPTGGPPPVDVWVNVDRLRVVYVRNGTAEA